MSYIEDWKKREELLQKFPDGYKRYQTSALLHNCINAMMNGQDPCLVIDQLITIIENNQKERRS